MRFDRLYMKKEPIWKTELDMKLDDLCKESGLSPEEMNKIIHVFEKHGMLKQ